MTRTYPGGSMILDPETGELRPNPNDLARGPARQAMIEAGLEEVVQGDPVSAEPTPVPEADPEPILPEPTPPETVQPDDAVADQPDLTQPEETENGNR